MRLLVLVACMLTALTGCEPSLHAQRQTAYERARASAEAEAQRIQQARTAADAVMRECRERRLKGELHSFVESAQCSNPSVIALYQGAGYPYMDLINLWASARLAAAEKVDKGQMTDAEMQLQLAELATRIASEEQRRRVEAQQLALQQATVQAQQDSAAAASESANVAAAAAILGGFGAQSAPRPAFAPPLTTSCYQAGAFTNCATR